MVKRGPKSKGPKRERAGVAKSLGMTLNRADYKNLELIQEGLRHHWLWYMSEMTETDFRAIVRARIKEAKTQGPQANKATEILFRYALGSEAPTASGSKPRIQILIEQLIQNAPPPSPEEVEAIDAIEGDWVYAPSGADANSPAPVEAETGSGGGESREEPVQRD